MGHGVGHIYGTHRVPVSTPPYISDGTHPVIRPPELIGSTLSDELETGIDQRRTAWDRLPDRPQSHPFSMRHEVAGDLLIERVDRDADLERVIAAASTRRAVSVRVQVDDECFGRNLPACFLTRRERGRGRAIRMGAADDPVCRILEDGRVPHPARVGVGT